MGKIDFSRQDEEMAIDWMDRYKSNAKSLPTKEKCYNVLGKPLVDKLIHRGTFFVEDNSEFNSMKHRIDRE